MTHHHHYQIQTNHNYLSFLGVIFLK